jgi:hypothetical protein
MNAGDVEEVILVVVGQKPFHLGRVHAAVGLAHVDDRQVELWEDVDFHAAVAKQREPAADDDANHHDHDGNGMAKRELNGVHGTAQDTIGFGAHYLMGALR